MDIKPDIAVKKIKTKDLYKITNPTPEQLQERINKTIELYNYHRSEYTDDEIAKLRAYLSSDSYTFNAIIFKPALEEEAAAAIAFEKIEAACYIEHFNKLKSEGMAVSVAETLARKYLKVDERYLSALTALKTTEVIARLTLSISKAIINVANSMSYKSN